MTGYVTPRLKPWSNGHLTVAEPVLPDPDEPWHSTRVTELYARHSGGWRPAAVCRCGWTRYAASVEQATRVGAAHEAEKR